MKYTSNYTSSINLKIPSSISEKELISSLQSTIPDEPLTLNLDRLYKQYKTSNKGKFRRNTKGSFGGKKK